MPNFWRIARLMVATSLAATAINVVLADSAHASSTPPVATSGVRIAEIYFDSAGPDNGSNRSLNREWVKLVNTTNFRKNIAGWTVHDSSSHKYTFKNTVLAAHSWLFLHTGRGFRNAHNRYWGSTTYIWNNSGDSARLANASGQVIGACAYSQQSFASFRKFC
jgi:hypothetical protein